MSATLIALLLGAQGSVTLKYQPKVGTIIRQKNTMSMTGVTGASPQANTTILRQEVKSKSGSTYTVVQSVEDISGPSTSGQNKSMIDAMKRAKTTMNIDSTGKITVVGKPAGMMGQMQDMAGGAIVFPSRALKVGDSWKQTMDMGKAMSSMGPGMKAQGGLNFTYKVKSIGPKEVLISVVGTGKVSASAGQGPQAMSFNLGMNITGSYSIERATGILNASSMSNAMSMGGGPQAMTMNQVLNMKRL